MRQAGTTSMVVFLGVLTGVVAMAVMGGPALAQQPPAPQAEPAGNITSLGERLDPDATNGSAHTSDSGYNLPRANAANTHYINTTGPTNPITTRWTFSPDANKFSVGPLVVNDTVYIGTDHLGIDSGPATLYALDAWTGEERWSFPMPGGRDDRFISLAVFRDTIYVSDYQGRKMYALDANTGEKYWEFVAKKRIRDITVSDGTVYASTRERLYALGALRGEEKWVYRKTGPRGTAVKDGIVYGATGGGSVFALDVETGAEHWKVILKDGQPFTRPSVANGNVYVGTIITNLGTPYEQGHVFALDAETGEIQWEHTESRASSIASPSVLGNTAYFRDNHLHAVNAQTGTDRWNTRRFREPPVLLNDIGYVRGGSSLYTLDPKTGAYHARFAPENARFTEQRSNGRASGFYPVSKGRSSMAVLNGSLYIEYSFDEPNTHYNWDKTALYALGTPEFTYTNLSVTPESPDLNESVTVTATVRNTGTGPGEFNATLVVNDNITNTTTARLDPRTSRTVTFAHMFAHNGTYTVEIGGLTRRLTVGDVAPAPTPTPTSADDTGSPTQTVVAGETATPGGSDSTPTDTVTPTATSGSAPGFGVTGWVAAVALVAVLVGIYKRD